MHSCCRHIIHGDGVSGSACKFPQESTKPLQADQDSIWNGISFAGIALLYFPISQTRAKGAAMTSLLGKIDYVGGATSIMGLTLL